MIIEIPVSGLDKPALVDQADYGRLVAAGYKGRWCWNVAYHGRLGYVRCRKGRRMFTVAKLILGLPPGRSLQVQHCNGIRTDLRRINLRAVTPQEVYRRPPRNRPRKSPQVPARSRRRFTRVILELFAVPLVVASIMEQLAIIPREPNEWGSREEN